MSQHDMDIANQGFPAFRSDLNNALQALASTSSGTSVPSTTYAYQLWIDTTTATANVVYIRNSANDGNIEIGRINQTSGKFIFSETAQFEDGSAGAPSISFISDTDLGFYRQGADRIDGVAGGTIGFTLSASGVVVNENSADAMDFRVESTNDTHKLFIDSSTDQLLFHDDTSVTIGGVVSEFQCNAIDSAQGTSSFTRFSADANGHSIALGKSRGASVGTFTVVQDNDVLGSIDFYGADGTDMATKGASISARINGTPGGNDLPTELVFSTTADAGSSVTERLTISQAGHIATVSGNASTSSTPATNSTATGSVAIDFATGDNHHLTLTGNVTSLTASNETSGQSGVIIFTQDATGGRTVSLSSSDYETAGGGGSPAITLSSAASAVDVVPYYVRASGSVVLGTPLLAVG
jgi:hypothetical protein